MIMVTHEEWTKIGNTLQDDSQHNLVSFLEKIKSKVKGSQEVEVCEKWAGAA